MTTFATMSLRDRVDEMAPDGAEIRLLPRMNGGSMCHCTLPPGRTSRAVKHRTIEEIWYFLEGKGEVWRRQDAREEVVIVKAGVGLTIPAETHFQFRNTGPGPLTFLCVSMPPWPGAGETENVEGHWS